MGRKWTEKEKQYIWDNWEADETYYRYNLPDGSSIVICEYNRWLFWKLQFMDENPDSKEIRLYLLKNGYQYLNDCRTSETDIVDHLKNVQKGLRK